jgi:hypothetical protein
MSYTGFDFANVCELHRQSLQAQGIDATRINFVSNARGTYSWNLAYFVNARKQFDAIYFDGHHTFYVDFPAALLCTFLLRPGGTIVFDDYSWTLSYIARAMYRSFGAWRIYRNIYDLTQYDPDQVRTPHIRMIVHILIGKMGFVRDEELSLPDWVVLRAP